MLPLGMFYFYSEDPYILIDDEISKTHENWNKLNEFQEDMENIVTHKI